MIEKLEKLAVHECDTWLGMAYEDQEAFSKEFAAFVDANPSEIEAYLLKQQVTSFCTLHIALEAISRFSKHPEILLPTVKKVLDFEYTMNDDSLYHMTLLDDIDTVELFEQHPDVYMQHMDLLVSRLKPEKERPYLMQLLDVFEMAMVIPVEQEYKHLIRRQWFDKITEFANYGETLKLKLKAREVIKNLEQECELVPLTFGERVKKLLGAG
jgi:hypothetical protein